MNVLSATAVDSLGYQINFTLWHIGEISASQMTLVAVLPYIHHFLFTIVYHIGFQLYFLICCGA